MNILTIVLGFICVCLVFYLFFKSKNKDETGMTLMLKQDMANLSENVTKLKEGIEGQLTDRFDKNHEMMRNSIEKQFSESSKIIADVTERLARLDETNKRVVGVAEDLKSLQNVLQNPKQRGVLGEYYLSSVLENVLPPGGFKLQHKFKDGEIVDAVVILDKGKLLPIDSKFSLENYNRLIEEKNAEAKKGYSNSFRNDLKKRIDETSKYIRPSEGTMDYAFMFIPSEAIYYDLLINKIGVAGSNASDLIEYAFRKKNVIIVSPTTFMAYLQTVLQGLRGLEIEEQAKEIQERVGQLGRHLVAYEGFMQSLGGSLKTTVNHYNKAHHELGKIDKDIVKISGGEKVIDPLFLDKPSFDQD
jgi:DNA recombination protein RmuC